MMSSFRADVHQGGIEFVPSAIFGARGADPGNGEGAAAFTPGTGFASSSRREGDAEAAEQTWTREQIEALEQAAFSRGVDSAREANENESRVCEILERAAQELSQVSSTTIATNRGLLLGLAMEIAQKWVGEELRLDPSLFVRALNRVITACETKEEATLRLHPSDRAMLVEMEAERVSSWLEEFHMEIVEDVAISPGMFRLEGPEQSIDGTTDAICDRLRDALREAFEAALPEVTP